MLKILKTIRIKGIDYFIDELLKEIRNIRNLLDAESVSPDLIEYWKKHNITEL